ncbi:MAG: tryptophan 2,3-dioxygenase, partial [Cytophagales bacterium]
YLKLFKETGMKYRDRNLWKLFNAKFSQSEPLKKSLREFDQLANVLWPLAHLKSAGHYLQRNPEDIKATGGTNWQKYLPPRFQKIMFFPDLWSEQEKEEWGKVAIDRMLKN